MAGPDVADRVTALVGGPVARVCGPRAALAVRNSRVRLEGVTATNVTACSNTLKSVEITLTEWCARVHEPSACVHAYERAECMRACVHAYVCGPVAVSLR